MNEFPADLLDQAFHLLHKDGDQPKQASLRRAVSTAYYALFHLLIDEAVSNWAIPHQRSTLARTFEHGKMKRVCEDFVKNAHSIKHPDLRTQLETIAKTFNELQQNRHIADYDNSFDWTKSNTEVFIVKVETAFSIWRETRTQREAQDFLLSLFLPKLPRHLSIDAG